MQKFHKFWFLVPDNQEPSNKVRFISSARIRDSKLNKTQTLTLDYSCQPNCSGPKIVMGEPNNKYKNSMCCGGRRPSNNRLVAISH